MRLWARLMGREEEEANVGHEWNEMGPESERSIPGGSLQPEPTWRTTEPDDATARHDAPWAGRQAEEQVASGAHGEESWGEQREAQRLARQAAIAGLEAAGVTPAPNPIVDSGVHVVPPAKEDSAARCEHCGGRVPTDHELLTDLLEAIAPNGPEAMRRFYERLFEVAPNLRELFPARIEVQEEKLLAAIVALLKLFQAGDEEMEQLDAALARFGRSHTRFEPAATIEEYSAVWTVLAEVLTVMLGEKLTERHVKALRRAYEYAAGKMLAAQATASFTGTGRRRRTV